MQLYAYTVGYTDIAIDYNRKMFAKLYMEQKKWPGL